MHKKCIACYSFKLFISIDYMYSVENSMYFSLKKSEKLAMKLGILMNYPNLQDVN